MISDDIFPVFILGCERSGSTWLSNIMDAHTNVELFMEPFAKHIEIFPFFPERNFYIEDCNNSLIIRIRDEYNKLSHMKYLFYMRGDKQYRKILEWSAVRLYVSFGGLMKYRVPRRILRIWELNLNKREFNVLQDPSKSKTINCHVTKELRLNFKLGVLSKTFPGAKYLLTIRHPGPQISSVTRLMSEGRLSELRESLFSLPEYLQAAPRLHKFSELIDKRKWGSDMEEMLIVWWLVNYDTLITDCKRFDLEHKIIYHEDLSENFDKVSRDIFQFIGLDYSKDVETYLRVSSSATSHVVKSPVDTNRNSREYYKKQMNKVNPSLVMKMSKMFKSVSIVDELQRYYPEI